MDLKKLLTIYLPHELTIRKFREYVADNKAITIIKNYFSHRQKRVKVEDNILAGVTSQE